jgi:hypothetical protein
MFSCVIVCLFRHSEFIHEKYMMHSWQNFLGEKREEWMTDTVGSLFTTSASAVLSSSSVFPLETSKESKGIDMNTQKEFLPKQESRIINRICSRKWWSKCILSCKTQLKRQSNERYKGSDRKGQQSLKSHENKLSYLWESQDDFEQRQLLLIDANEARRELSLELKKVWQRERQLPSNTTTPVNRVSFDPTKF